MMTLAAHLAAARLTHTFLEMIALPPALPRVWHLQSHDPLLHPVRYQPPAITIISALERAAGSLQINPPLPHTITIPVRCDPRTSCPDPHSSYSYSYSQSSSPHPSSFSIFVSSPVANVLIATLSLRFCLLGRRPASPPPPAALPPREYNRPPPVEPRASAAANVDRGYREPEADRPRGPNGRQPPTGPAGYRDRERARERDLVDRLAERSRRDIRDRDQDYYRDGPRRDEPEPLRNSSARQVRSRCRNLDIYIDFFPSSTIELNPLGTLQGMSDRPPRDYLIVGLHSHFLESMY